MKYKNSQMKFPMQEATNSRHATKNAQKKKSIHARLDLDVLKIKYEDAVKKIDKLTTKVEKANELVKKNVA